MTGNSFETAGPALTEPVSGDEYMAVLLQRPRAWLDANPKVAERGYPPLLEWFIREEDVPLVRLPDGK